jgi:hypothetical protein
MKRVLSVLALTAAASVAAPALAQSGGSATYRAILSGPAEAPPNASFGTSLVTIDISDSMVMVDAPFRDLAAGTTVAHIHCCTSTAFSGTAGVALPLEGFPTGVRAGEYSAAIPLYESTSYDPGFLAAHGGTVQGAASALVDGINANEAYVNIHTSAYPNGEIRGFLVAAPVPEPAEWAMLGAGVAGLLWLGRRRGYPVGLKI